MKINIFEILNYIGTILLCASYPSQIIKTFKTKSVKDMSLGFWIPLTLGLFLIGCNAYHIYDITGAKAFLIGQVLNTLLAFIIICQILIYRKGDK